MGAVLLLGLPHAPPYPLLVKGLDC